MATLREMIKLKVEYNKTLTAVDKSDSSKNIVRPKLIKHYAAPPLATPTPIPKSTPVPTRPPITKPPVTTPPTPALAPKLSVAPVITTTKPLEVVCAKVSQLKTPQPTVRKVEKEKVLNFCKGMPKHLSNELADIVKFFKSRPKDPLLLMYDKDFKVFATSTDGETWVKNLKTDIEFAGYITVPERGTVWQSRNSRSLYLVLDFCNLRTIKPQEEPPLVIYMDELGNNKSMHIVMWHSHMMFCDHTICKDT